MKEWDGKIEGKSMNSLLQNSTNDSPKDDKQTEKDTKHN